MGSLPEKPAGYNWLLILLKLLLLVQFSGFEARSLKVPAIIVFGDSTVDAGNNNQVKTLAKSNFPPYGRDFEGGIATGRFCNGRLVTDFISEAFGIKSSIPAYLDPSYSIEDFATGVTFGSAATGFDNLTAEILNVIPLWKQLENFKSYKNDLAGYLGERKAQERLQEALFLLSIGSNDFILNYFVFPERSTHFTVEQYQNFLIGIAESFILELYNLGARKISVAGLPPLGCLPLMRTSNLKHGSACREELNDVAASFNEKMTALLSKITQELKDIKLVSLDILEISLRVIKSPHLYGLEEVVRACCGTGTVEFGYACHELDLFSCTDASVYAFWDIAHGTEKFYRIVADHLMNTSLAEFA